MPTRNSLKKAVYWPAVFICILSFGSALMSVGYQTAGAIHSGYLEATDLGNTNCSRGSLFGLSAARTQKVGTRIPAQTSRPAPPNLKEVVTASWYGPGHQYKLTASGQRFDMHKNTLAHKTLPLGTKVRLVNSDNGKSAEGVVNDRGPYIKGRDVDLSYEMAKQLGFVEKGIVKLNIEKISVNRGISRRITMEKKEEDENEECIREVGKPGWYPLSPISWPPPNSKDSPHQGTYKTFAGDGEPKEHITATYWG